jgi:hypothetical protein
MKNILKEGIRDFIRISVGWVKDKVKVRIKLKSKNSRMVYQGMNACPDRQIALNPHDFFCIEFPPFAR